jgi:hypothetical protein
VDCLLQLPFAKVSLKPAGVWFGEARHFHAGHGLRQRYAIAHLAGAAAVELVTGERDRAATIDYEHASAALNGNAVKMERAYAIATVILKLHRSTLESVAERLRERGSLTYTDVQSLIASVR